MNMDEEIMFIYNIQEFLKSNKTRAKFKFLNDEITLAKDTIKVDMELLVNSKLNYTRPKHYPISTFSDETIIKK
ncbi:hypothetical protein KYB31_08445 [Clostridium felsineum]|uniref:hypothetical protein n=1 Tax=Clostridium felsineum TaxID=36839 RepID=UPI00214D8B71|nr:hypothetical protein [Clostridium felsineum]MCR3759017.1 hypothetical protein [Clostridium felsineum]